MKKTLLLTLVLCIGQLLMAQVSKTLTLATAGTLTTTLTAEEKTSITNLTLSGSIDARDVKCMRDEITKLEVLDLSGASIVEYTGSEGIYSYGFTYPANEMPEYSFCYNSTMSGKTTLKSMVLPNMVTSIGGDAFYYCTGLTSITIPNTVTSIGFSAFGWCSSLTSITLSNTLTLIGNFAFTGSGLTSITIPSSVTTIGSSAFNYCSSLVLVYCNASTAPSYGDNCIPASVKAVYVPASSVTAYKAASGWSSFNIVTEKRVTINNPTAGGLAANIISKGYGPLSSITHLTVTGNLNAIDIAQMKTNMTNLMAIDLSGATLANNAVPDNAFEGKTMLTSVVLPSTVTSIGNYAFSGCSNLSCSIPLPASVTSIGSYAYCGCGNLTGSLTIPAGITIINNYTFWGCNKLTGTLTIPDGVLSIGQEAFSFCTGLKGALTIPNSVTDIGYIAFNYCTGFDGSLTLSNSLTTLGVAAFQMCTQLSGTLNIPASLTEIPENAFSGCSSLTELTIPKGTTSISDGAFNGCSGLQKITVARPLPPTIYANTFNWVNKETCQLVVPTGASLTYQTTDYWGLFIFVTEANISSSYVIQVQSGTGGSVVENNTTVANSTSVLVDEAGTKTFEFVAEAGYQLASLTYNDNDVMSQVTNNRFTTPAANANAILSVTFEKVQYTLAIQSADNGTVNQLCEYGSSPSFTFTPAAGWSIHSITYNSMNVTNDLNDGVYTVPGITSNSTLSVVYVNSIPTAAPLKSASSINVYTNIQGICVDGLTIGESVSVYQVDGKLMNTLIAENEDIIIPAKRGSIYLLKIGTETFKVAY